MPLHTHAYSGTSKRHSGYSITLFWKLSCLTLCHRFRRTHLVQLYVPPSKPAIVDGLPPELRGGYTRDFIAANAAFQAGWLEATSQSWEARWQNWCAFIRPLGENPYLQHTPFKTRVRSLTGFTACTRTGFYSRGRKVQSSTASGAITAIGQTIAMVCNNNPTKVVGLEKFLPALQVLIEAYSKEDLPTRKMLPVEVDVPELPVEMGNGKSGTPHAQAIEDLALIAFYYLLGIGEYMVKGKHNNTKQTVQFKFKDISFFKWNKAGTLVCLPWDAPPVS
jgi:hypothetical protein